MPRSQLLVLQGVRCMRDELLAYLLDDLDPEQRARIEARIAEDPIWQHELERLRACVEHSCDCEGEQDPTPDDLVKRTCCFVQEASSRGQLSPATLPAKLSESWDEAPATQRHWSLIDLAMAASILLALGSLLLPAIQESREAARRTQCASNAAHLGRAFIHYMDRHHGQLPPLSPHENAGMYMIRLADSGLVSRQELGEWLLCPASLLAERVARGEVEIRIPTHQELATASQRQLKLWRELMGGDFAIRIGFTDEQNRYCPAQFKGGANEPLLADKPNLQLAGAQSDNHGGCGQNVCFRDQSVRFITLCIQTGPDRNWYLNKQNLHAAGIGPNDIVLIRSEVTPSGEFTSR